jgi:hypothetical protein
LPCESELEDEVFHFQRESVFRFMDNLRASLECHQHELLWTLKNNHYALFLYFTKNRKVATPSRDIYSFPRFNDGSSHHWADMLIGFSSFTRCWGLALFDVARDEGIPEVEKLKLSHGLLRKMDNVYVKGARFALGMALRNALLEGEMLKFVLEIDKSFYAQNRVLDERLERKLVDNYFNMISREREDPLLILATRKGDHQEVKMILDTGAEANVLDSSGKPSIVIAVEQRQNDEVLASGNTKYRRAEGGLIELLGMLIAAGANINLPDGQGKTALHHAARHRSGISVATLLSAGAKINLPDSQGKTALHHAVRHGSGKSVAALSSAGANIDLPDSQGQTALHHAAIYGSGKSVATLLSAGANINLADSQGQTAYQLALMYPHSGDAEKILRPLVGEKARVEALKADFNIRKREM